MSASDASKPATVHRLSEGLPVGLIAPPLREATVETVERRRAHLWLVAGILLLACSTAILLLFVEGELDSRLNEIPTLRWTFLALSVAFILYVIDQERRLRRLTAALIEERVLTSALQARITDLATLTRIGRVVNSVLTLREVLETILDALFELTHARSGSVMLLDGTELEVAASAGERRIPVGARVGLGTGVAGWVADHREPVLITGRLAPGQFPGHVRRDDDQEPGSSVVAPLFIGEEIVGVLSVERPPDVDPFTEAEMRSVAVFAEHAATAVHNARRYERERATVERLADALEQRAEFAATMVHQLKTPLTVILGFASLLELRWGELDEERRTEILSSIRSQGERILSMVGEIIRATAAEAGAEPRWEPVDLVSLLTGLIERMTVLSEEREGRERLIRLIGGERAATMLGDPEALSHVFENLLDNAIKYSPAGSPIEVVVHRRADEVQVDIVDHGPGFLDEESDVIFEKFRGAGQADGHGVGLGLYIVRTLVQSHAGRVWATNNEEQGATFSVALPVRLEELAEAGLGGRTV